MRDLGARPMSKSHASQRAPYTGSYPACGVKRWIVLAALGIVLLLDAIARWFIAEGTGININEFLDDIVDDYFSPAYLTGILGVAGLGLSRSASSCGCAVVARRRAAETQRAFAMR